MNGHSTLNIAISKQFSNNFKCKWCSKNHHKGQCKVREPVCYNCGKRGHIAKECGTKQKSQQNNSHKCFPRQGFRKGRTAKFHEITARETPEFQIVAEDGANMGNIDHSTANATGHTFNRNKFSSVSGSQEYPDR